MPIWGRQGRRGAFLESGKKAPVLLGASCSLLHSQPVPYPPPSSQGLVQISASFNFRGTKQGVFCRMDVEQMFLMSPPPPGRLHSSCVVGAVTPGPSSVFAFLAYHCMFLLPLDFRVLGSLVYLIIPQVRHRPQSMVNGQMFA